ncbi:MAG: hypothetical protein GQ564_23145, partial [Bacteroidales bacterium]|nr:hypothetical protein [Bacteroidales bacterium]
ELNVAEQATFTENIDANNGIDVLSGNLNVTDNTNLTGTLDVDDATSLDQLTVNTTDGNFDVSGTSAANISATNNNIDLSTITTGDIDITAAGDLNLTGTNVTIAGTFSPENLDVDGATTLDGTEINTDDANFNVIGANQVILNNTLGLQVANATDLNSSLDVAGQTDLAATTVATNVRGTLNVAELATFTENIDASNGIDVTAGNVDITDNLNVIANTDINGTLDVQGQTDLAAAGTPTNVRGTLNVTQLATFTENIDANNGIDVTGNINATADIYGDQLVSTIADGTAPLIITSTTPVANLSIGGNAATVTTNANLTGEVTSVGNTATVTNTAVISKVLTGYTSGAGAVAATDNILEAIQKLDGNNATNANLTGPITSIGNATSVASQTGTGSTFVMNTSPTLVTPDLGTPSALVGTNITGTATGFTAGNVTTNANLTGMVTSVGNATTVVTNANLTGEVTSAGNAATVTNAAVIGKILTGYTSGAGAVAATDNILEAIQKLDGNNATNANLTGPITSVGNATSITDDAVTTAKILNANVTYAKIQDVSATNTVLGRVTAGAGIVEEISTTGSGNVVRATSPTLVTPTLGVATATRINDVTITDPGAGATLTIADTKTLTVSDDANISGTNSGDITLAAIGSTPNANGASLSGQALTLQPADASFGGVLTTGAQTIAGAKTFNTGLTASGAIINLNNNSNFATNINTGSSTETVTIGGSATQTIEIGNGVAAKTVNLGSSNTTSTTTILSGSGAINLNVNNDQPTNINTGTSTGAIEIGNTSSSVLVGGSTTINGALNYGTTTGTDTYSVTLSPAPTAYVAGMIILLKPGNTNTGASTLNVNGLGAKDILYPIKTSGPAPLPSTYLTANNIYMLVYDGTQFLILNIVD